MKRFFVAALFCAMSAYGVYQTTVRFEFPDGAAGPVRQQKDIVVRPGDIIVVGLDANATTGFRWSVVPENSINDAFGKGLVTLEHEMYHQKVHPRGFTGVGGVQVYTFETHEQGSGTLTFEYHQPWMDKKDVSPARTVVLNVTVSARRAHKPALKTHVKKSQK